MSDTSGNSPTAPGFLPVWLRIFVAIFCFGASVVSGILAILVVVLPRMNGEPFGPFELPIIATVVTCGIGGISVGAFQVGLGIVTQRRDRVSTGISFLVGSTCAIIIGVCLGRIM